MFMVFLSAAMSVFVFRAIAVIAVEFTDGRYAVCVHAATRLARDNVVSGKQRNSGDWLESLAMEKGWFVRVAHRTRAGFSDFIHGAVLFEWSSGRVGPAIVCQNFF